MDLNSEQYPFVSLPIRYQATCPRCAAEYRIDADNVGRFKWTHCPLCHHEMQARKED